MRSEYRTPVCIASTLWIVVFACLLVIPQVCLAQSKSDASQISQADRANRDTASKADASPRLATNDDPKKTASSGSPASVDIDNPESKAKPVAAIDGAPLTDRERAMLDLIRDLQERVAKLESQTTSSSQSAASNGQVLQPDGSIKQQPVLAASTTPGSVIPVGSPETSASVSSSSNGITPNISPVTPAPTSQAAVQADDKLWGIYTPNLGFKLADTKYGDLSLSIYSYVRYLNQLGLDENYTDAFGNIKSVQRRQDMQLLKLQMKFLGWVINPKLRYFLYAWTSNANQGQGAQVVLAGNLQYTFNKHLTLGGGIRSLPGTRSVEGNFPFWFSVDSRHIADEFFRPSYTSGIWAMGQVTDRIEYIAQLGNNMSTLGVPATRIDNGFNTFSGALVWFPTGDFRRGFSGQGWGDFEHHDKFATRLGGHFSRSDESKESQPNSEQFENTQLRLSDGTVIFTPNIFGQGVTVDEARYQMTTVDAGFKYRGFSLEGEYFWRWINNFKGAGTAGLKGLFDHGFQLQGSAMVVPKTLQAYVGYSTVFGQYGHPHDFRVGANWFPFKNHVVRWNTEGLYLYKSPVGYTSVPFAVGGRGWVFHTSFEVAF